MATFRDGATRRATENTVKAMRRSAEGRLCKACGRKSALRRFADDIMFGSVCRFCGDEDITMREFED